MQLKLLSIKYTGERRAAIFAVRHEERQDPSKRRRTEFITDYPVLSCVTDSVLFKDRKQLSSITTI